MRQKIYLIIFILLLNSFINAQEISREQKIEELRTVSSQVVQTQAKLDALESRQDMIAKEVLMINSEDRAEAERLGAEAVRIFPAGLLKGLISFYGAEYFDYSIYSFDQISDYYAPRILYRNNFLEFTKEESSFGLLANIGGTLIETINEQNKEFTALDKYKLPEKFQDISNEFFSDGIIFRDKVQVIVGNTYLIRAFNDRKDNGIFALKVKRKDSDGSLVIFVKEIKNYP